MIVTYQGIESFRVQFGDAVLAFNPVSKESKFKSSRFGADVALISANHPDLNGRDAVSHGGKEPFVISGPGEYEIKEIFIKGLLSQSLYGGEELLNTIYTVVLEGMNITFLGALSEKELSGDTRGVIDTTNILFVPIGAEGVLSPADAYRLAVKLEPNIIIPMHYGEVGEKSALQTFLKEGGAEKTSAIDKLTIKRKDLDQKEGEIVVLEAV